MCHEDRIMVFSDNCLNCSSRYHDLLLATGSALILVYDTLIVAEKLSLPGNSAGVCLNTKFIPILLVANVVFTQSTGKRNSAYVSAQSICVTYFRFCSVLDHKVQLGHFERPS